MATVSITIIDSTGHRHSSDVVVPDTSMRKLRVWLGVRIIKLGCKMMSIRSEGGSAHAAR